MNGNYLLFWIFKAHERLNLVGWPLHATELSQELFDAVSAPSWVWPAYQEAIEDYRKAAAL